MRRLAWVCVAVALAACGETTIDGGALEAEVREDAQREGLVLDDVDCPSPEANAGDRFTCTVTVKGERRALEVTQRNDDGNVEYSLTPLLRSSLGSDAGGDEASVTFVIDAVNRDVSALCDYATTELRRALGADCAEAAAAEWGRPLRDFVVTVAGDAATAAAGDRRVRLARQPDGSWLIADGAG
jgi:hypothetical protein